jgi:hypothetical protein
MGDATGETGLRLEHVFLYGLQVPALCGKALGCDVPRYGCCHYTEAQGHAETCSAEVRVVHIEAALARSGIAFVRITREDERMRWLAGTEPPTEADRAWLAEFLGYAPGVVLQEDAALVDVLAPFAFLLREAARVRDFTRQMSVELPRLAGPLCGGGFDLEAERADVERYANLIGRALAEGGSAEVRIGDKRVGVFLPDPEAPGGYRWVPEEGS